MSNRLQLYRYEIIAFMTGAAVMILEIVGSRLIAPYFGASTYVWTAVIGVILGALAVGYAVGGRLADRDNAEKSLGGLLLIAAVAVLLLALLQKMVLTWLAGVPFDIRFSALLAALLLFATPSMLIGSVSPHLAKIRITSLATSGKSVGRLEAAGALGSIAGTFLCGYFLLGAFGSRAILIGVVFLLIATSVLAVPRQARKRRVSVAVATILSGALINGVPAGVLADIDSSYSRYQVKHYSYDGEPIVALTTDNRGLQSGVSLNDPEKLVFSYVQQFDRALKNKPDATSILVIGGGTFTFPAAAARDNPRLQVDAVEIDPKLTEISKRYFGFKPTRNLHVINEDGRTLLNRTDKQYDLIFLDAYNAVSPPFQLTTRETFEQVRAHLKPGGALISNTIGRYEAYFDPYLQAMQATIDSVFAHSVSYPAEATPGSPKQLRNYLLFASQSNASLLELAADTGTDAIPRNPSALVLTDDYAPIEQLIGKPE